MAIFISFDSFNIGYFIQPCKIPCSMQHVFSTPSTYPGSCKSCFSCIPVFGRKISLIFPIIYHIAHLHNWPTWPSYPFDLCWQLSWMTCLAVSEGILRSFPQLALKFHWDKTCLYFELLSTILTYNYIEIIQSVNQSCQNQSSWWLCRRLTRSTKPWLIKYRPSMSNYTQVSLGHLVPQHFMLKSVSWLIYLLVWANFAQNWTCQLQRNYTGPHSSSIEDIFQIKITLGSQSV